MLACSFLLVMSGLSLFIPRQYRLIRWADIEFLFPLPPSVFSLILAYFSDTFILLKIKKNKTHSTKWSVSKND